MDRFRNNLDNIIPITGNSIFINRITIKELLDIRKWELSEGLEKTTCRPIKQRSIDEAVEFYKSMLGKGNMFIFGIYKKGDQSLIGKVSVFNYNYRNKSIEIGYFTLHEFRGNGYTSESIKILSRLLFTDLKINKIMAQTGSFYFESNMLLKTLGFRLDGVLREHHELDGKLYEDYIYSLLRNEYDIER